MENKNSVYYDNQYLPSIIKWGRITSIIGAVAILLPMLVLKYYFGIEVDSAKWTSAVSMQLAVTAVWWIVDPLSIFPALGTSGTIVSCLSGNMHNLRLPCALTAQRASGLKEGSPEGSVMATIGVCVSVFINIALLSVGVVLGSRVLSLLPASVTAALGFLLPALYGALFAQYAVTDIPSAIVAVALALGAYKLYLLGMLNWVPLEPYIVISLGPMVGTIAFSKIYYGRKEKKEANE